MLMTQSISRGEPAKKPDRKFSNTFTTLTFATLIIIAGTTHAADRVVIHFADIGSITSWHAESSEELFVENTSNQWYRITFLPPCQQLPFAIGIAFEPDNLGNIDKDSSIVVEGERCYFKSIEETVAPVSKKAAEE
ncbi:MAG: DUF6491 family protein [Pseudomonadota bacterium]